MKKILFVVSILALGAILFCAAPQGEIKYSSSLGTQGFSLNNSDQSYVEIVYSINKLIFEDKEINEELFTKLILPGQLLPADEGTPDLPGESRFIAIPQGSHIDVSLIDFNTVTYNDVNIAPAPRIPLDTEDAPLEYNKDYTIYNQDALYPENPIITSKPTSIRGVDVISLGIKPFQYNPVSKQLIVYTDMVIDVQFIGGNNKFGEDRLRNIWFEPILQSAILNYDILPEYELNKTSSHRTDDYEYIVITPDDPVFLAWADSISIFRNEQGIRTGVVTTADIGGNTVTAIESYINDAYNTWDIPPVAVLLIGDYGTVGNTIVSPIWDNYCVSDHIYADVTGNEIEDLVLARITARDESELDIMISKMLDYERTPPEDANVYNNPITALGWQTERWFQICSEAIGGFWNNELGKDQIRINAIYEGNPQVDPWSTYSNTPTILNYFGPNGLGYIPQTPAELGGWTGGNATMVNNAINSGAFMLVHRDHGSESGWGEPNYGTGSMSGLNNETPVFVFSINCLTGKYNINGECFAEKFHRHPQGALGLIAASEVSYSFVNDTFMWGMMDYMWPEFLPDMGTTPTDCDFIRPAFANSAGKLFLFYSNWPNNNNSKEVTYNLFHHHGGAFMNVYSEVPQQLTVTHPTELLSGITSFEVNADEGSFIALSVAGEVIGTAIGTGSAISIDIPVQTPNNSMKVVVTKQNYYRYSQDVDIIAPGQYVIFEALTCTEISGHIDNSIQSLDTVQMDITLLNIGLSATGSDVAATISTSSNCVNILDNTLSCGSIPASSTLLVEDAFQVEFLAGIEDNTEIIFSLEVSCDGETWNSFFEVLVHAPDLVYDSFEIDVTSGSDEILDPGETGEILISIANVGSGYSYNSVIMLYTVDPNVTLSGSGNISSINPGEIGIIEQPFIVSIDPSSPIEYFAEINILVQDENGLTHENTFNLPIGFIAHNFEAGEGGWEHMVLGDEWLDEWHLSSYRNHTEDGMYSMKCGGLDELSYSNFVYAALVMPEVELATNSTVRFHHWMEVGANNNGMTWDGGLIEISVDGGEWEQVTPVGGYPCVMLNMPTSPFAEGTEVFAGNINWEEVEIDLSEYSGMAQLRFVLGSAGLVTGEGWYIDDIYYTSPTGISDNSIIPVATSLNGNFPNPFNPSTTITYSLSNETNVNIEIYNMKGQKVRTLKNEEQTAGDYNVVWNGKDDSSKSTASGVYFYKMQAGNYQQTKKMILMK
ncbi:MAG: hypothetical protein DRH79_02830 [Candidatus Cloacimonadota bacterium]|nr:MAG: hypothetical protein DRH79_02830 [Candidatus Cloacimonadota bacterium]